MVCIEKRPYTLYGRLATLHFRYLTCLLDRGHINLASHRPAVLSFLMPISYIKLNDTAATSAGPPWYRTGSKCPSFS